MTNVLKRKALMQVLATGVLMAAMVGARNRCFCGRLQSKI
jgi:hypothetical protein